ncbi:type II toxin-antitoxin system PemK/MazF family toxin [Desulfonatronum parangueonense]
MKYRPGEIVLLPFPFSDHSARKKRPVLVLSQPDARGDFASLAITSKETHEKAFALIQGHLNVHPSRFFLVACSKRIFKKLYQNCTKTLIFRFCTKKGFTFFNVNP